MTAIGPRTAHARTARSRRTRAALVSAVREELRESGTFTAETVAERAACSPATFYSHFGSKDDALAAAFAMVLGDLVERSTAALNTDTLSRLPLEEAVRAYVDGQAGFFAHESLVFRAALNRLPHHRPIRDAYRDAERVTLDRLTFVLTDGQHRGVIRAGPVDLMAEAVLVLAQGINNPRVLRPDAEDLRHELARAITAIVATDPTRLDR